MSSELHTLLGDGDAGMPSDAATIETAPPPPPSPTVLTADRWTRRAGERLAAEWAGTLQAAYDDAEAGTEDDSDAAVKHMQGMADPNVAADAITTLLAAEPEMAANPESAHRAKFWKQLLDAPETQALRRRTVASAAVAEIAAAEIASSWVAYETEHPAPKQGEGEGGEEGDESPDESVARIRAVRNAVASAAEAADAAESIGAGLGLGAGGETDKHKLAEYTKRLRRSPSLSAIMRMAGRFIAKANRLQRQRTNLSGMEITGVELSGDLSRVLPGELALIAGAVPELEMLAMVNLVENRALSYRRIRREPKAMGPIVVSVDESGSMDGERIAAAKGLALAMASIARAQKRPFMLVAWSDGPVRVVRDSDGPDAIVAWLEQFIGGGTSLHGPLWQVTTDHWPSGIVGAHADHIIITDDNVGIEQWLLDHYTTWAKGTNVRTFGIGIGVKQTTTIAKFCDGGVWCLPTLDLDNPAVDVVLSIGPEFK